MKRSSFWQSFRVSVQGLLSAFRTERNLWIEAVAATLVVALAGGLRLPLRDWAVLSLTIGLVITAELLNTALERVVDLVSPEYHETARLAKDTAAGAVLLATLTAVAVGLCLLGPPLLNVLGVETPLLTSQIALTPIPE